MLGRFDRKFYIDFLRDIDEAEMSGILRLRQNRSLKALFFESGYLVFGISNLADEELGQHLVNLGRLSDEQLKFIQSQITRTVPLTQLLMQFQLINHDELARFEHEVITNMAISCFNWDSGEYTFDGSKTADHEFKTQIRALDILAEGIRCLRDDDYIYRALGDHGQFVKPVTDVFTRTKRLNLNSLEGYILSLIDRPKSLTHLISGSGCPEMEVLRSLYVMLTTGVLDPLEEASEIPPPPRAQPSTAEPTAPLRAMPVAPTASSPRASGAFQKLSPLDQTYSSLQASTEQPPKPVPRPVQDTIKRATTSKINTAKLEALAGIKIRSSVGAKETEGDARAEQWFIQGKQLLRMGDMRRAEPLFRQASEAAPDKAKYLLALSLLLIKRPTGRKEAEGLLLRCCELEPQAVEPRIQLAMINEQQGMMDRAEQLYRSVLNIDPEHPVALQKVKKNDASIWKSDVGTLFKSILKK